MFLLPLLISVLPVLLTGVCLRFIPAATRLRNVALYYLSVCAVGIVTPWIATFTAASEMTEALSARGEGIGCVTAAVGFLFIGYVATAITFIICLTSFFARMEARRLASFPEKGA